MRTVIINRKTWLRGTGKEDSALRMPNGKKCCIGFLATTLGAKPKQLTGVGVLEDTSNAICQDFSSKHYRALNSAYYENDVRGVIDQDREKSLCHIGKRMGVRFQFIN